MGANPIFQAIETATDCYRAGMGLEPIRALTPEEISRQMDMARYGRVLNTLHLAKPGDSEYIQTREGKLELRKTYELRREFEDMHNVWTSGPDRLYWPEDQAEWIAFQEARA